jgi:hypothetical protein
MKKSTKNETDKETSQFSTLSLSNSRPYCKFDKRTKF